MNGMVSGPRLSLILCTFLTLAAPCESFWTPPPSIRSNEEDLKDTLPDNVIPYTDPEFERLVGAESEAMQQGMITADHFFESDVRAYYNSIPTSDRGSGSG